MFSIRKFLYAKSMGQVIIRYNFSLLQVLLSISRSANDRKQIMTSVSILGCYNALPRYRDIPSALRPSGYPYT